MNKLNRFKRPMLLVLAIAIAISAAVWVYAKYIYQETIHGSLTITASLGKIDVWEHLAVRQNDGSYELNGTLVRRNDYYLIPGLDIPKDPFVQITEKTNVPVYVFIKVDTNPTDANHVTYGLLDCWKLVEGTSNIYVYSVDGVACPVSSNMDLPILQGDLVEVSQNLQIDGQVYLNFTAAMSQVDAGLNAAMVMALFTVS